MLNYIKDQINEKEYMSLTEAVAEKVASGDDSVRDMFLDDPDALVLGSEDDPEVAKVVDSLPEELPETAEVNDSDVEKIKEYFSITEADLEDEFDSEDMYENDDEDIYASDVQKMATEGFEDIEEALNDIENILEGKKSKDEEIDETIDEAAEMSAEDNYENEGAPIYDSKVQKVATEEVEELEDIEEALDDIENILEGKISNKVKKVGKDIKEKLPFGKKEGSEEVDDEEEIEESAEDFDLDDFII